MSRKTKYKIFNWIVILVAYSFLAYKITDFFCHNSFEDISISFSWHKVCLFLFVLLLLPINILLEAGKWQYALLPNIKITFRESVLQTLLGFVGGWVTPNKLGDLPMRVVRLKDNNDRIEGIVRGFIGSVAVVDVSLILGLFALLGMTASEMWVSRQFLILTSLFIFALQLLIIVFYHRLLDYISRQKIADRKFRNIEIRALCHRLTEISIRQLTGLLFFSAVRYLVYCLQIYLMLCSFSICLPFQTAAVAIPIYYMLLTISPSLPAADIGIRGSWGVVVFSLYTPDIASIAVATTTLWAINNVIPMICGSIILQRKN
ncbi:MAG: flippase-like domain-containing protein [Paludibacteraceae bacterium]|nr:flippase-like domain-containing protein [Paludibacteraceae bacterium]